MCVLQAIDQPSLHHRQREGEREKERERETERETERVTERVTERDRFIAKDRGREDGSPMQTIVELPKKNRHGEYR